MKIIDEFKLNRGSITEKLEEIGRKVVQCSSNMNKEIEGHIICTDKGDIDGMVLVELGGKEKIAATKLKYIVNGIIVDFEIKDKKDWNGTVWAKDWRLWKDYLKWIEFRCFNNSKGRLNRVLPSLVVKKELNPKGVALEIGFYLVHRKIIEVGQILELFDRYIKKEFPKTYAEVKETAQSLNIIPKLIDNWITSKHHLGLKYHIGIYLQNIIREERLRKFFSETCMKEKETYMKEKRLKKHLYYLNRAGKKSAPKVNGRYQFSTPLLNRAEEDIKERETKKELAEIYANLRKIPYKSAQRWVQLQKRKGLSLEEIAKRILGRSNKK